jgi:hypothetical protein
MNKSPKMYNCEYCEYKTSIKCNYQKHLNCKHKKVETINEPIISNNLQIQIDTLKAENEKLKAEIETLKSNHKIELMELKLSMYENQTIKPSRKSISPSKPEPVIEPPKPEKIPKKPHNMPPLEYLNKYFPPMEHNMLDEIINEKLIWQDIQLSTINLEQQYISLLKPLIEQYKIVFHSGEKNHSLKFYYVNHENEWVENLTDLEYPFYLIYKKIELCMDEKFKTNEFNADEKMELMLHYNGDLRRNVVVKQLLDVMKLPE